MSVCPEPARLETGSATRTVLPMSEGQPTDPALMPRRCHHVGGGLAGLMAGNELVRAGKVLILR